MKTIQTVYFDEETLKRITPVIIGKEGKRIKNAQEDMNCTFSFFKNKVTINANNNDDLEKGIQYILEFKNKNIIRSYYVPEQVKDLKSLKEYIESNNVKGFKTWSYYDKITSNIYFIEGKLIVKAPIHQISLLTDLFLQDNNTNYI